MNKHQSSFSLTTSPANLLFTTALLSGILLTLSAHTWFSIWIGLELNLFGFIPLIIATSSNQEKEAACKYFLAQATPSAIFLVCLVLTPLLPITSFFLSIAVLIKLGAAPCHQWFPSVISRIGWPQRWALITIQKVGPFFILLQTTNNASTLLIFVAAASSIVGGIGGINQTLLRPLIAYSSIGHIGWIIAAILISNRTATLYFASYILIISTVILSAILLKLTSIHMSASISKSPLLLFILITSFINIGGLPPLFGFFIKATVIRRLISENLTFLLIPLIIGSVINLYYYLKVVFVHTLETSPHFLILQPPLSTIQITLPALFIISTVRAATLLTLF